LISESTSTRISARPPSTIIAVTDREDVVT
jgi:hypothetical protein